MNGGPLAHLLIVELGNFISAPYCTKMLTECGAKVVKVEKPGGGDDSRRCGPFRDGIVDSEASGLYLALNTDKLGITLNLQTATGLQIMKRLLARADIFVENNNPRHIEEWLLTFEQLQQLNPRLIMTSITAFGWTGPYKYYNAHDIQACGAGGTSIGIGHPEREPLAMPLSLGDFQAGAAAAGATMVALLAREATGQGEHVDIAGTDNWAVLHNANILRYIYQGIGGGRNGSHGGMLYPDTFLPCKDGYISIVCNQLQQWIRFLALMGNPEWTKEPRYRDRRAMTEEYPSEVDALVTPWLGQFTRQEILDMCREAHVPVGLALTPKELLENEHLQQRGFWVRQEHPVAGTLALPGAPYQLSETPAHITGRAPFLGEHNREVYGDMMGFGNKELVQLRNSGII